MKLLKDYCLNITDGEHGSVTDDIDGEYYLLANENINDGRIVNINKSRRISRDTFLKINSRCKLEKDDVLISTVGTLGKVAIVEDSIPFYVFQRSVGIIKPNLNVLDSKFLYYYLSNSYTQKILINNSKGAVQKCIYISELKNLPVEIPNIEEQKSIIKILSLIDKKININNNINNNLQQLAEHYFDYWFLQFEFPAQDNKPYKSKNHVFSYNNLLKTPIPQGWEVTNIRKLCALIWGQCPNGENILPLDTNEKSAMLYCSGAGDMRNGIVVDPQAKTNCSKREAHPNDILMSVAGSIGALCICDKTISLGRAAVAFRPKTKHVAYCYFIIKKFINRMLSVSSGSIQKVVNDSHIDEINFPYNEEIVSKFDFANQIIEKCIKLTQENNELIKLRNELLPLLMNGQVSII